jgi:hypothetical protein
LYPCLENLCSSPWSLILSGITIHLLNSACWNVWCDHFWVPLKSLSCSSRRVGLDSLVKNLKELFSDVSVNVTISWLPFAMLQHLCDSCGAQRSFPFPANTHYGPLGSSCVHSYTSSSSRNASTTIPNRQTQVCVSSFYLLIFIMLNLRPTY